MFRNNKCTVIYWDGGRGVSGLTLSRSFGGRLSLGRFAFSNPATQEIPARLTEVFSKLDTGEGTSIIVVVRPEGVISLDLMLPNLRQDEMGKALEFELPGQIPVSLGDMEWTYRTEPMEEGSSGNVKVRVVCVGLKQWDSAIADIASSGIKLDAVTHPFMFFRELPEHPDSALDDADKLIELFPVDARPDLVSGNGNPAGRFEGLGVLGNVSQEQKAELLVCLLAAEFALKRASSPASLGIGALPDALRPQRFKVARYSAVALFSIVLLLGTVLMCRHWWDARTRHGDILAEKRRTEMRIGEFRAERESGRKLDELIRKVDEANSGNPEILQCLHVLSQKLPASMWLTTFSSRDDEIDITICTGKDQEAQADLAVLGALPVFSGFSIRSTRRDSNGTLTIFVHILWKGKGGKEIRRKSNG